MLSNRKGAITISRRTLLTSSAAFGLCPSWAAASPLLLTAAPTAVQIAPSGYAPADLWCFNDQAPGPEIRVQQGQSVRRRFVNDLDEASSVHWHGIRIANGMDGVPGLTQKAVEPGGTFEYDFIAPDAGTYWYHSHNRSWEQMARGLYGPLVVEEAEPPDVDQDIPLVIDDWRLAADGNLAGGFGSMHDNAHAGRLGNFVTVNGAETGSLEARVGERLRLRLINVANARIFQIGWRGLRAWIAALDGMPLETPLPAEQVTLAPAQRADLFVDVVESGEPPVLFMIERDTAYAIVDVTLSGVSGTPRSAPPRALPPNATQPLGNLSTTNSAAIVMEGGAMRGLRSAKFQGETLDGRGLAEHGMVWALNGVAGLTEAPFFTLRHGQTQRLSFTNKTAFPHGMHLHGHHFREIRESELGPWRDTLLVAPNETREIAFVAENPGKWLLHCHMLGHQAAGMKTWFEVAV